jgi:hypothetical protein
MGLVTRVSKFWHICISSSMSCSMPSSSAHNGLVSSWLLLSQVLNQSWIELFAKRSLSSPVGYAWFGFLHLQMPPMRPSRSHFVVFFPRSVHGVPSASFDPDARSYTCRRSYITCHALSLSHFRRDDAVSSEKSLPILQFWSFPFGQVRSLPRTTFFRF